MFAPVAKIEPEKITIECTQQQFSVEAIHLEKIKTLKGTVSPVSNWLKVLSLERPCLRHQALTI
jgi:hypothetical protein